MPRLVGTVYDERWTVPERCDQIMTATREPMLAWPTARSPGEVSAWPPVRTSLAPLSAGAGVSKSCVSRVAAWCRRADRSPHQRARGERQSESALHHACTLDLSDVAPEGEGFCCLWFRRSSLVALGTAHRHSPQWLAYYPTPLRRVREAQGRNSGLVRSTSVTLCLSCNLAECWRRESICPIGR